MRHNQSKGSPVSRALNELPDEEKERLLSRPLLEGRIGAARDYDREVKVSELYEELRLMSKHDLCQRLNGPHLCTGRGYSRQELISEIINKELPQ